MGLYVFVWKKFDEAWESFNKMILAEDQMTIDQLQTLYQKNKKVDRINPELAMWLSIVPGLGQIYAGDYEDAANSVLINAAFLTLYFQVASQYSLVDGMLAVLPWFQRYYIGGFQNAKTLAVKKKERKRNEVLRDVLLLMQESKKE